MFALLVASSCVSGLSGQFHQPGMQCQVTCSPSAVALSGQFLVSTRRVPGGMCRRLRGGVMVVHAIGVITELRHGPAATAMPPSTLKSRAHTARCRGEAKSCPDRAKMLWAVLPGFHPGLVELALQAGIADGGSTRARVHTATEALIFPQA